MATYDNTAAEYRYFVTNLVTNQQIAEIPFKGVSYERALKGAGAFGGNIAITPDNAHLDLYESTMPGRTGLYVVRNGVCVWGGIIWGRSYNVNERVLNISASEFTSYFYHRRVWKTWGQTFNGTLVAKDGVVTVTLVDGSTYVFDAGSTVRFVFYEVNDFRYNGYYEVLSSPIPTTKVFATSSVANKSDSGGVIYEIPNGTYTNVTVYAKTNTYDYVRTLIDAMSQDFALVDFPNGVIEPGIATTQPVTQKAIVNNIAILTTTEALPVVPGQEVNIRNLDPLFDGTQVVSTVTGNVITINNFGGTLATTNVSPLLYRITSREVFGDTATVTTNVAHQLYVGQTVNVSGVDAVGSTSKVLDGTFEVDSIPTSTSFKYKISSPTTLLNLQLSAPTATVTGSPVQFLTRQEVTTESSLKIATVTTGEPHNFTAGQTVNIAGFKDYTTIVARQMVGNQITYTTSATHYYSVGNPVTITGLADTANITEASLSFSGDTTTFTIKTSTPHNLVVGNAITVSQMVDSYAVSQYEYFSGNNVVKLYTSGSHNINANAGQSITLTNLPTSAASITSVSVSNGTATAVTSSAHGFVANSQISISGVSKSESWSISSLTRASNVVTLVTTTEHGLATGDTVSVYSPSPTPADYNGTFSVTVVDSTTLTYTANGADSTITETTSGTDWWTLYAIESYYYKDGVRITSTADATFDNHEYLYNGGTGTATQKFGAVRFDALSTLVTNQGWYSMADITAVTKLEMTMTRISGLGNTNATAYFGLNSDTNLANQNTAPTAISGSGIFTSTGWGTGATRTLTLPTAWRNFFKSGTAKGITVGLTGETTFNTSVSTTELIGFEGFGPLNNSSPPSNPPYIYLELSYTTTSTSGSSYSGGTVTKSYADLSGTKTVQSVPSSTSFTYNTSSEDFSSHNVSGSASAGANPLNGTYASTDIVGRTANSISLTKDTGQDSLSLRSGSGGTMTTSSNFNGNYNVASIISSTQLTYQKTGTTDYIQANVASYVPNPVGQAIVQSADLNITANITAKTNTTFTVTAPTSKSIAFANATPTGSAVSDSALAGTFTITAVPTPASFKYAVNNALPNIAGTPIYGYANTISEATLTYGTYGPYSASSDIGFDYSDNGYSANDIAPTEFRGYEVRNVGEELDKYSDIIDGFEYRVDCIIDPITGVFSRNFVLLPVMPDAVKEYIASKPNGTLPAGESVPLTYYGADSLVFEFPGNISDLQLEESAENSATRFFMVGNIGDLGDDISQPYSVATASDLLNPDAGNYPWPILDEDEASDSIYEEQTLYDYAERYLLESRPPDGKITVTVNGSVEPVVGSYAPGDWCALIINDEFIKQRLSSDLEPRNTVLLRKINSFSVSVPDSVTFPESISLNLIPEWQVDKRGK